MCDAPRITRPYLGLCGVQETSQRPLRPKGKAKTLEMLRVQVSRRAWRIACCTPILGIWVAAGLATAADGQRPKVEKDKAAGPQAVVTSLASDLRGHVVGIVSAAAGTRPVEGAP